MKGDIAATPVRDAVEQLVALEETINRALREARALGLEPELLILNLNDGQHLHVHMAPDSAQAL